MCNNGKESTMFTQFKEISKLPNIIDSVWGMLSWNGRNYFVGNVYVKLDCIQGVQDVLQMLDQAQALSQMHRRSRVILMGDFNARHQLWNDTCINSYGKYIESNLDWTKFCVHDPGRPIFLAKNGNSLIDFQQLLLIPTYATPEQITRQYDSVEHRLEAMYLFLLSSILTIKLLPQKWNINSTLQV